MELLEGQTSDARFDTILKQSRAVQLEQSPYVNFLSEQQTRNALRFMGRSADERVTHAIARGYASAKDSMACWSALSPRSAAVT